MSEPGVTGMAAAVADLKRRREYAQADGPSEGCRLSARERLVRLFDPKTFSEWGLLAGPEVGQGLPDGLITGIGKVGGRLVAAIASDPERLSPSVSDLAASKVARMVETARRQGLPLVWLLDFSGLDGAVSRTSWCEAAVHATSVPQVAAILGPCTGEAALVAAMADFVPMVAGRGAIALAHPAEIEAESGERATIDELGGARIQCDHTGLGDLEVAHDEACLQAVRDFLGYWPDRVGKAPPTRAPIDPPLRAGEDLMRLLPESPHQSYDMKAVLARLVDDGRYFELKPRHGPSLITALARLGGRSVGVVASQPKVFGGLITPEAAQKAATFVARCATYQLPLVFLLDSPGATASARAERGGMAQRMADLYRTVRLATVPKLVVQTRTGATNGLRLWEGRALGADLVVAWPTVVTSDAGRAPDAGLPRRFDDVIDPRETRRVLLRGLELCSDRQGFPSA